MQKIPRPEYPRPQFERENWLNLNGEWDFSFDENTFDKKIIVPYAYQTKLSGIDIQDFHDIVWYKRKFEIPETMKDKNILIHFGAVDYECDVYVNDKFITHHVGGHICFENDITEALQDGENEIILKVHDDAFDLEMPRGKQFWEEKSKGIFYTRTTGIWQTVWLEAVNENYIKAAFVTPDLDKKSINIRYELAKKTEVELEISISVFDTLISTVKISNCDKLGEIEIGLNQQAIKKWNFGDDLTWSPEKPILFDLKYKLTTDDEVCDEVKSYFGMRKVSIENGKFMLNNRFYYQKLLLDQGYWEDSLLTAPSDEDFVKDITLSKQMGFNGVRKHQKIEDPRFLYHADKLGFLVWGEISAAYVYSRKYVKRITDEWIDEIFRDYNHPCIVAWTPLNESWGVENIKIDLCQQSHSAAMVYLTKSLDKTRPVISNDGWEHTCTDILTVHDYESNKEVLKERYKTLENIFCGKQAMRQLYANGWKYRGEPIIVSEFGGISFKSSNWNGWGYSNAISEEDFAKRYYDVVSALLESELVQGFCYTQLTDVEQEINGLLTYDRKPKIPLDIIYKINNSQFKPK